MIELRTGTKIWIAAGVTDMRRGFDGLSAKVQTVLEQQPFSGHVFVFRVSTFRIWFLAPAALAVPVVVGRTSLTGKAGRG